MKEGVEQLKKEIKRLRHLLETGSNQEAEKTFENIFNNSSDLIYIHDEHGIFINVNKAVIEKYGYAKDEIIGKTPLFLAAPGMNDMEAVNQKILSVWKGGPEQKLEWWSIKKDGTLFLKELILRKGVYFGQEVMISTGRDITERNEVENTLIRKNHELKKLNEALDAFVYSASHDLKAPLTSIKGLVNLMRIENATGSGVYLDKIGTSTDRLIKFVDDLVEYSRNARTDIKNQKINLRQLLENVIGDFEFMPENEHVSKIINVPDIKDFYSDQYRLNVILNNLISNAIRYSKDNDQAYVKIEVREEKDHLLFIIEDNGVGISPEHKEHIYNMFYRATDAKTGSGLGLYIVRETIIKLNASIDYTSTVGKGTRFYLKIPNGAYLVC